MARVRSCSTSVVRPLSESWECARTEACAVSVTSATVRSALAARAGARHVCRGAAGCRGMEWRSAARTRPARHLVSYALRRRRRRDPALRRPRDNRRGLAERHALLQSDNMFLPQRIAVRTGATNDLHICFRSLSHWLARQRGRARWRPRLVSPSNLRFARTTLLGHMPGWCPTVHPVGPVAADRSVSDETAGSASRRWTCAPLCWTARAVS